MHGSKRHLTVAVALACWLVALTGSALAAPPGEPPGNSGTAPGQEKKAEPAQPAATPAPSPAQGKATAPGQQKKAEKAAGNSSTPTASTRWYNAQHKPKKNVPPAAGSIPESSSGPGPGNSGYHKYTVCHNGHAITVDVHSAKAHVDAHGDSFLPYGTKGKAACSPASSTSSASPAASSSPMAVSASAAGSSQSAHAAGGVAGVEHTASPSGEAGGVAGAFATIGNVAAGSLPFTGFPLWAVVLIGLAAVAIGYTLLRRARPATTRDVV